MSKKIKSKIAGGRINTMPIDDPLTFSIDISEVCEYYPDTCEFCGYNCSGWCSLLGAVLKQREESND